MKKRTKKIKGWIIQPELSMLGDPMEVFSTSQEAEKFKNDREVRIWGLDILFSDFVSPIKIIPCEIILKDKK